MAINSTYALVSSGSWIVPKGVSSITVECFGSVVEKRYIATLAEAQSARAGASYSKSTNIAVTEGQVFYHNIGAAGQITWFNTVNSAPVVGVDTPTTSCLAVGGATLPASQVAANIGNVKYAGGAGNTSSGTTLSGTGGNAGPNGPGAPSGAPYSNTPYTVLGTDFFIGCGGGANGGSQGGLGVIPYGRTGSGGTPGAGNGAYTVYNNYSTDVTVTSDYFSNIPQLSTTNYGANGGGSVTPYANCDCSGFDFSIYGNGGFIVITLNSPTKKSVVFQNNTSGSFVLPSDFVSIDTLEAVGIGGSGASAITATNGGGGGGGSYAKTFGSSISPSLPLLAGSTVVYYRSSTTVGGGLSSWLRIGTNSAPSSTSDGVLAVAGSNAVTNTGGAGGSSASNVGDIKYSGGTGGAGWTSSRYNGGGGGGGAGPNGAGSNGGAGFNTAANRGGGGGGSTNNNAAPGGNGLTDRGGNGANGLGTGGVGAQNIFANGSGTNGAGSGGGYGNATDSYASKKTPSNYMVDGIYGIIGGQGGGTGGSIYNNAGGGYGGGSGVVVLTYNTVASQTSTSTNFFLMF